MAIEVLKLGRLVVKGWKGTCGTCHTEVFFLTEDAKTVIRPQFEGDHATCECPLCTGIIYGYTHKKEL